MNVVLQNDDLDKFKQEFTLFSNNVELARTNCEDQMIVAHLFDQLELSQKLKYDFAVYKSACPEAASENVYCTTGLIKVLTDFCNAQQMTRSRQQCMASHKVGPSINYNPSARRGQGI